MTTQTRKSTKSTKSTNSTQTTKSKAGTSVRNRRPSRNDSAPGQRYIESDMEPETIPALENLGNEHKTIIRKRRELAAAIEPLMERVGQLLHEHDLKRYQCQESRAEFILHHGEEVKVSYPRGRPAGES